MAKKNRSVPQYGTVMRKGIPYYRTRILDADGKQVSLYAATCEELYEKQLEARREVEEITPGRRFPRRPFSFSPASADPVRCAAECAPNRRGLPLPCPATWHLRSRPVPFQSSGQRIPQRSNRFPVFHVRPGTLPKSGTGNHSSLRSGHFP